MDQQFYSYSVFIAVPVGMFQVASNSSDDIPDENSNNSLSSKCIFLVSSIIEYHVSPRVQTPQGGATTCPNVCLFLSLSRTHFIN